MFKVGRMDLEVVGGVLVYVCGVSWTLRIEWIVC